MKITITESKLKEMIAESVNNMLNESSSYDNPILKWVYWCTNYYVPVEKWIYAIWGSGVEGKHMMKKFDEAYSMDEFMRQLDDVNQYKLIDYVMNNF